MKLNLVAVCAGSVVLLTTKGAHAQIVHPGSESPITFLGSDWPQVGDESKAHKLIIAGNASADAGNLAAAAADYESALSARPFYREAIISLARCAAVERNFTASIDGYAKVISPHHEDYNIDLLTEYALVLNEAGSDLQATAIYNHVVDLCREGRAVTKMEIPLPVFRSRGSETGQQYSPGRLQAMAHLIRAMNASNSDSQRIASEMHLAISRSPRSAIMYFYQGVFLSHTDKTAAKEAFQQALALDGGSNVTVINKRIAALEFVEPSVSTP